MKKLVEKQNSLSSIPARLAAPTPVFWIKVRTTMVAIGSASGVILATFATAGLALPVLLSTVLTYGMVVGATGAALSGLPVDWDKVKKP